MNIHIHFILFVSISFASSQIQLILTASLKIGIKTLNILQNQFIFSCIYHSSSSFMSIQHNNSAPIHSMFKVVIKIEKVNLKIKEEVELHIIIRKDHKHFTHCRNERLKNGQAFLSHTSEFLIDAKSPKFEIDLYLLSGQTKKKGGVVLLNLKSYALNSSHRIIEPLKKTPLSHSTIALELLYMQSQQIVEGESLISLQKLQEMAFRNQLKGIVDNQQKLIFQNNNLNDELTKLKQKNVSLKKKQADIHETMVESEEKFKEEMNSLKKIRDNTKEGLDDEKKRIGEIVMAINASGNKAMVEEMGRIINRMEKDQ